MIKKSNCFQYTKYLCHSRRIDKKVTNEFRFDCKKYEKIGMGRYLIIR